MRCPCFCWGVNVRYYNPVVEMVSKPERLVMKQFFLRSVTVTLMAMAPAAWADQALATAKNCMTCHMVDKKVLGPSFKEVAGKYKGDKAAADRLATKIMQGGSGVWGTAYMPKNGQVNEAEAKKLAAWVLSLN